MTFTSWSNYKLFFYKSKVNLYKSMMFFMLWLDRSLKSFFSVIGNTQIVEAFTLINEDLLSGQRQISELMYQ